MRRARDVLAWLSLVWTGCFQDQSLPEGESGGTDNTSAQTDGTSATSSASTSSTSSDTTPTSTSTSSSSSSPTSTSPTETSAASDTSVECPDGEVCLEGVDAQWEGPVAIMLGSDAEPPAMCPAGWEPRPSHFADLDVSPFACECSCPDVAVPTCEYLVTFFSGTDCDGDGLASQFVGQDDCTAYLGSDARSVHVQDITNVVDCGTPSFEPPGASTWGTRLDVCVPEVGEACSLGDCVPAPPPPLDGELCVFQSGDVQCPGDSAFEVRHVVYVGYEDQRECSCSCFAAEASCGGTLVAYTDNVCGGFAGSTNAALGCAAELDDVNSADVGGGAPVAACQPFNDLTPRGEVTPAGPTTFCCTTP